MGQPVTLKDIARKTNLSVASVSKALAGYPHVSKATQARVRAASHKLNYQPRAQRSASRVKHRVKCLATESWVMESGQWLAALAMASRQCDVRLEVSLINNATAATSDKSLVADQVQDWRHAITQHSRQADGLLLFGCFATPELQVMEQLKLPYVVVGDLPHQDIQEMLAVHSVTTSKYAMGRQATELLIACGHEKIGFFCGKYPPGGWNEQWLHGYQMALRDAGIIPDESFCQIIKPKHQNEIGDLAANAMLKLPTLPTAFVTPSVLGAACFCQSMKLLGQALSHTQIVMGGRLDEAIAMGMQHTSLIDEPVEELAVHAIDLLSRLIEDKTLPPSKVVVPYRVHDRLSR